MSVPAVVADASALAASLVASVLCAVAVHRGAPRRAWSLLSATGALCAAGEVVRLAAAASARALPVPSVVDALWLGAAALAIAAPLVLPGGPASVTVRLRTFLDGCLVLTSVLFAGWGTVLGAAWEERAAQPLASAVGLLYGVAAIALGAIAVVTIVHVRRVGGGLVVLASGLLTMAMLDITHASWLRSARAVGVALEPGRVVAYVLIALAAVSAARHARSATTAGLVPGATVATSRPTRRLDVLILLPYVPLVADAAVAASRVVGHRPFGAFLSVTGVLIVALVLVRQLVALVDHVQLTGRLEQTVADLNQREAELRHLAFHDTLTGLANRALFWDRVDHAVALGDRGAATIAVLYLDLDGFKAVNDEFGHSAGDELLAGVAQRLSECVRGRDTVSRFGGDEFAILLEGLDDGAIAETVARRVLAAVEEPFILDGGVEVTIGASIGIAVADATGAEAETLVQTADRAMYAAKSAGRGGYVHADLVGAA